MQQPIPKPTPGEREAFERGWILGAKVNHDFAQQAVVTALLAILGKEPGDGPINLGAAGTWFASSGEHALAERVQEAF